ncbi:hypothetical protein K438DRAFT_245012 [Mycena galopus ATCC 62051]|nr:hypothetical protein K438DRAFT_245012 [Mycena galopus ATCC 62051]
MSHSYTYTYTASRITERVDDWNCRQRSSHPTTWHFLAKPQLQPCSAMGPNRSTQISEAIGWYRVVRGPRQAVHLQSVKPPRTIRKSLRGNWAPLSFRPANQSRLLQFTGIANALVACQQVPRRRRVTYIDFGFNLRPAPFPVYPVQDLLHSTPLNHGHCHVARRFSPTPTPGLQVVRPESGAIFLGPSGVLALPMRALHHLFAVVHLRSARAGLVLVSRSRNNIWSLRCRTCTKTKLFLNGLSSSAQVGEAALQSLPRSSQAWCQELRDHRGRYQRVPAAANDLIDACVADVVSSTRLDVED